MRYITWEREREWKKLYTSKTTEKKNYTWIKHYLFSWSNDLLCFSFFFQMPSIVYLAYELVSLSVCVQMFGKKERDGIRFRNHHHVWLTITVFRADDGDRIFMSVYLYMHVLAVCGVYVLKQAHTISGVFFLQPYARWCFFPRFFLCFCSFGPVRIQTKKTPTSTEHKLYGEITHVDQAM